MPKIVPNKPLLIMLYGYPGAGKSHVASQLTSELKVAHIQSERIRYQLFEDPKYDKQENDIISELMNYMTEQFLQTGVSVIYDINAMREGQRRALRDFARKFKATAVLIWVQIDIESAFGRVASRDRRKGEDRFAMSLDRTTFDNLVSHMQNPTRDEEYLVISGKQVFKSQLSSIIKRLRELGLVTDNQVTGKIAKPELVNMVPSINAGRVDMKRRNIFIR